MSYPEDWLRDIEPLVGGFRNKRVLDVGCDWQALVVQTLATVFGVEEAVGINLIAEDKHYPPRARTLRADVRELPFPDDYFDVIVSSSAFEHIRGLDQGLNELHRVLKKGGHVYSHFGPIWSTCYGHHLWVVEAGKSFTYHNVILPPWCHLLMEMSELRTFLESYRFDVPIDSILNWVYHSDEQNRLFFEDYETIFQESPFRSLFVKGYYNPKFMTEHYRPHIDPKIFDRLYSRYPRNRNWMYDGMTVFLRKD